MPFKTINYNLVNDYYDHHVRFEMKEVNETFRNKGVFRIYRDREIGIPSDKKHRYIFIWHEDIGRDKDLKTCVAAGMFPDEVLKNAGKYNIPDCFYDN